MRFGISHFRSITAAVRYYSEYMAGTTYFIRQQVERKIEAGEIHIGKPILKPGQKLSIIAGEGRYQIEEAE